MTALEQETFFLMEMQGATYPSVMAMPYSRRPRLVEPKQSLENDRRAHRERDAAMSRSRSRRRR